jgi:hypothetical protein
MNAHHRNHATTKALQRRLAELEKKQTAPLRRRFVWWKQGEPEPQAEPGEHLTIYRWRWSDEDDEEPPSTARQETP